MRVCVRATFFVLSRASLNERAPNEESKPPKSIILVTNRHRVRVNRTSWPLLRRNVKVCVCGVCTRWSVTISARFTRIRLLHLAPPLHTQTPLSQKEKKTPPPQLRSRAFVTLRKDKHSEKVYHGVRGIRRVSVSHLCFGSFTIHDHRTFQSSRFFTLPSECPQVFEARAINSAPPRATE